MRWEDVHKWKRSEIGDTVQRSNVYSRTIVEVINAKQMNWQSHQDHSEMASEESNQPVSSAVREMVNG